MKIIKALHLITALATFVPSFTVAAKNVTLSVLTYYVDFITSPLTNESWNGKTRAQLIAVSGEFIRDHDVIVLEGCVDRAACSILLSGLQRQYPNRTPVIGDTGPDKGEWNSGEGIIGGPENGGVIILSKWPIVQKHQLIYHEGCGFDKLSNKGFAYVVLDYQGANIHVFGTDMQSDDPECKSGQAALYRGDALDVLHSYINTKNIPVTEPVIIVGGFNIRKDTTEFSSLLTRLDVSQPMIYDGNPWTLDTQTNKIAQRNYPDSPPEYIDFVLTDKRHNTPKSSIQTSLRVKSNRYEVDTVDYTDYSDHYPVQTIMTFDL